MQVCICNVCEVRPPGAVPPATPFGVTETFVSVDGAKAGFQWGLCRTAGGTQVCGYRNVRFDMGLGWGVDFEG